jgi:Fe-S-cluster-containing hydrogenase component 2
LSKDAEGGRVALDLAACTGAGKCVKRCPFLGIAMNREGTQSVKCDLCIGRLEQGQIPACAEACPTDAITYKPFEDLTPEDLAQRAGCPGAALVRRTGIRYVVDPDLCIACRRCARVCPAEAVEGAKKTPHRILQERCVTCGGCYLVCPKDAILAVAPDDLPQALAAMEAKAAAGPETNSQDNSEGTPA